MIIVGKSGRRMIAIKLFETKRNPVYCNQLQMRFLNM